MSDKGQVVEICTSANCAYKQMPSYTVKSHAMAQVANHWPFTVEAWVSPCEKLLSIS